MIILWDEREEGGTKGEGKRAMMAARTSRRVIVLAGDRVERRRTS